MSRLLSDLLGAREPAFTQHLNRLEQESGQPGVDLRLTSDISRKVRIKLRELGLDPTDTTGDELYTALQNLIGQHDKFLAAKLNITNPSHAQEVITQVVKSIKKMPIPQNCWALKHSSAKKLLNQLPPKHVMKQLHFRSIDSMLKRGDINEIMASIYVIESTSWRDRFINGYKQLTPSDFEIRPIKVIELNPQSWLDSAQKYLTKSHHNVIEINELGVIAVLPLPESEIPGLTLALLPQIIYKINKLRSISSYLKLNQVKPDFTGQFIRAITGQLEDAAELFGEFVSWDTIHKYYGRLNKVVQPEFLSPHIQPEDLRWQQAEDILYQLEPALKFWEDLDYVAAPFKNFSVPLGLLDNSISYCNQLNYGQHSVHYFKEALRREITMRYLDQPRLEDQLVNQFDSDFVEADIFAIIERGLM